MYVYVYAHICTHIHTCKYNMYVYVIYRYIIRCKDAYIYICIYMYIFIYMYICNPYPPRLNSQAFVGKSAFRQVSTTKSLVTDSMKFPRRRAGV